MEYLAEPSRNPPGRSEGGRSRARARLEVRPVTRTTMEDPVTQGHFRRGAVSTVSGQGVHSVEMSADESRPLPASRNDVQTALDAANVALTGQHRRPGSGFASIELRDAPSKRHGPVDIAVAAGIAILTVLVLVALWMY